MNVLSVKDIKKIASNYKSKGFKIVFTNGCFDLLHKGHLDLLNKSSKYGDILIIGLNSDSSVKKLKGDLKDVDWESIDEVFFGNAKALSLRTGLSRMPTKVLSSGILMRNMQALPLNCP